jgi:hypothetical protein
MTDMTRYSCHARGQSALRHDRSYRNPDMESAEEGFRLGIDEYIAKPANADTIVALLAEKLATRHHLSASHL